MKSIINQDYLLLIFNCVKYKAKAQKQKETWLKKLPSQIIYFHVIGDSTMKVPFLFDIEDRILFVNTEDDYNSLTKKVIAAYEAVSNVYSFKYIFKTDDDQNLLTSSFFDIVINLLKTNNNLEPVHYGGKIVDIKVPHISQYYRIHPELPNNLIIQPTKYCNGRFYFLSWEAIINLISKKEKISMEYFEDYAIGYHLSSYLKRTMLYINSDKHFVDQDNNNNNNNNNNDS
jgi:Galactosyltransferase